MNFSCGVRDEFHCKYWVEPDDELFFRKFNEINDDLTKRCGRPSWDNQGKWAISDNRVWFHNEQDRILFILKWL